ncbi:hypothetical protein GCK32_017224 [Trichostrongylus colubriformis]|uniref:Uncharacterized protein n=1 Tax=Trichostrongylus colubriformis TaxID=6319 RepID=A0AAN8FUQ4_TRICO
MEVEKVEDALIKCSSTVDELPVGTPSKEEILKRAEANIDAAQEKNGNTRALADQLVNRLQALRATSDSLEHQLRLCDQLSSITLQLELKGEHINNTFLQKQLLSKFSTGVQRHILRQKNGKEAEGTWSTKILLALEGIRHQ